MGRKRKAIVPGTKFGRLVVVGPAGMVGRNAASLCRCECGVEKVIMNFNLGPNKTKSCGCLTREQASARVKANPPRLKHGMRKTLTYSSWQSMVNRCHNPKDGNYSRYGGRGIEVCPRWRDPDKGILCFIEDVGERPSSAHSIDRIDGSKGYEPGNCRWATREEQNRNVDVKRSNSTGYKGIQQCPNGRWVAEIRGNGRRYHLGTYKTKVGAALAYNFASHELHGIHGVRNRLPPVSKRTERIVYRKVQERLNKER